MCVRPSGRQGVQPGSAQRRVHFAAWLAGADGLQIRAPKAPPNVTRLKRFSAERLYEERIVTRYGAAPHYGAQAGLLMKLAYWEQPPLLYFFEDSVNALAQMDYDYPPRHVYPQLEYYELLQQQYPESKVIRDVNMKSLWTLH